MSLGPLESSLCLCVSGSLRLCVSASLHLCVSASLCLCVSVSLCLCVSLSQSLRMIISLSLCNGLFVNMFKSCMLQTSQLVSLFSVVIACLSSAQASLLQLLCASTVADSVFTCLCLCLCLCLSLPLPLALSLCLSLSLSLSFSHSLKFLEYLQLAYTPNVFVHQLL